MFLATEGRLVYIIALTLLACPGLSLVNNQDQEHLDSCEVHDDMMTKDASAPVVVPDLVWKVPSLVSPRSEYSLQVWGWSYSDKLASGVENIYSNAGNLSATVRKQRDWLQTFDTLQTMSEEEYRQSLVWFEDTGRSSLARIEDKSTACPNKYCELDANKQLCTKPYDDPSPWCALASTVSELRAPPCAGSSENTYAPSWEEFISTMNEDLGKGISTEKCLGSIRRASLAGQFSVEPYPIPTLDFRLANGNQMPIVYQRDQWQTMDLPVAKWNGAAKGVRTGIAGKGQLGRWGPNFAADPVITRWKNNRMQIALVTRGDTGQLALPGGMLEPGDSVKKTVLKEFKEEGVGNVQDAAHCMRIATNDPSKMKTKDCDFIQLVTDCVSIAELSDRIIYEGPVDDPRNTDNAWMETIAFHLYCNGCPAPEGGWPSGEEKTVSEVCGVASLKPATDASDAGWFYLTAEDLQERMYASHYYMLGHLIEHVDSIEKQKDGFQLVGRNRKAK